MGYFLFLLFCSIICSTFASKTSHSDRSASRSGRPVFSFDAGTQYYYKHWCAQGTPPVQQYLYDGNCSKIFPSSFSRDFSCPLRAEDERVPPGYVEDPSDINGVPVDTTTLPSLSITNLDKINMALIMVRRLRSGRMLFKYFSNGKHNVVSQTWSSSKIFCEADAAGTLTQKCGLDLNAATKGQLGLTPLGDLGTVIVTYDETAGYTSNGLARYFANTGNHTRLNSLIQTWLNRPKENLGGFYGSLAPSDLSYNFVEPIRGQCSIQADNITGIPDLLSPLTTVELLRRLVLHREIKQKNRFPYLTWPSVQNILYGAEKSILFPGTTFGGMSADIQILVQSGIPNLQEIDANNGGQWRIFSKLGAGVSDAGFSQFVSNNYVCLPDGNGGGHEFILHAWSSTSYTGNPENAIEKIIQPAVAGIVTAIMSGALDA